MAEVTDIVKSVQGVGRLVASAARAELKYRADSWVNAALGFGTTRDKTTFATYDAGSLLDDGTLSALYTNDDIAAKIVNIIPERAHKGGVKVGGFDPEENREASQFLQKHNLTALSTEAWCWARTFGGGGIWIGTETKNPELELVDDSPEKIIFLRVIDRRYLAPCEWYGKGPKTGTPSHYRLTDGTSRPIAGVDASTSSIVIHESRLVLYPGERTEARIKLARAGWDLSVLQRPWEALRSSGTIWKAIETLVTDANQGVFKIKNLFGMIAGGQKDALIERIQIMDLTRSVGRAILLDADKEEFTRVATSFAGLSDISDRSANRLACAAGIPVTLLYGEAPAGLNATGKSDIQNLDSGIEAAREQMLKPRLLRVARLLLQSEDSPLKDKDLTELDIQFEPLAQPTASERVDMMGKMAAVDKTYAELGILANEEIALSRFGADGWSEETTIDLEVREAMLEAPATEPKDPNADPSDEDDDAEAEPVDPAKPVLPGTSAKPVEAVQGAPAGEEIQKQALNGAQIASLVQVVTAVANEEIPRESGIAIIALSFQLKPEEAEKLMGSAGNGFEPVKPEPPAGFGAPPGAPGAKPPVDPKAPPAPAKKPPVKPPAK